MVVTVFTVLIVAFAAVLGLAHWVSERIGIHLMESRIKLAAFVAGVSTAYLFLDLLPRSVASATISQSTLFFFLMTGFAGLHVIQKSSRLYLPRRKRSLDITLEHMSVFFIYYFFVGVVLVALFTNSPLSGLRFFIPILLYTFVGSGSMAELHGRVRVPMSTKVAISLAPLAGVIFAIFISLTAVMVSVSTGLVVGALLYIIVRDVLPQDSQGAPGWYVAGIVGFGVLLFMLNTLFGGVA